AHGAGLTGLTVGTVVTHIIVRAATTTAAVCRHGAADVHAAGLEHDHAARPTTAAGPRRRATTLAPATAGIDRSGDVDRRERGEVDPAAALPRRAADVGAATAAAAAAATERTERRRDRRAALQIGRAHV